MFDHPDTLKVQKLIIDTSEVGEPNNPSRVLIIDLDLHLVRYEAAIHLGFREIADFCLFVKLVIYFFLEACFALKVVCVVPQCSFRWQFYEACISHGMIRCT